MQVVEIYLALRKRILLFLRGRYFVVRRHRSMFLVDIYNFVDRSIEAFGLYERAQVAHFSLQLEALKPEVFIDIGANSGMYSVVLGSRFPEMDVLCFEPDRRCKAQLAANLFLNDLQDRVEVHDIALSDVDGQTAFSRFSDENRGRSAIQEGGDFVVRTARLDGILSMAGKRIAVKIDVEGHEVNVINGALKLLSENDCVLQVECFTALPELEGILRAIGYKRKNSISGDHYFARSAT